MLSISCFLSSFGFNSSFITLKFGINTSRIRLRRTGRRNYPVLIVRHFARENTGFHREYVNLRKCISIALLLSLASACLFDFDVIAVIAAG